MATLVPPCPASCVPVLWPAYLPCLALLCPALAPVAHQHCARIPVAASLNCASHYLTTATAAASTVTTEFCPHPQSFCACFAACHYPIAPQPHFKRQLESGPRHRSHSLPVKARPVHPAHRCKKHRGKPIRQSAEDFVKPRLRRSHCQWTIISETASVCAALPLIATTDWPSHGFPAYLLSALLKCKRSLPVSID